MKKIAVLVSLLMLAAACATQPPANTDTSNANKSGDMKSTAGPSEAALEAIEKASWDDIKKKDWDALGKLLASDFTEAVDSGVHDKAATLAAVKDLDLSDVTYSDWKMTAIDKDAALLTYKTTLKGKYKGQDVPPGPYYEASAYVNRNGEWVGIYYQETASKKMEPPPPAEKKAASSPATAAKPAETGADPIANEKIVWDLFKAKNWDGFASLLAPEFMEVEATDVYDKAGSVKGAKEFDASQFDLSDWKALAFDDDAKLVTYTVTMKGPKPMKEYHATIWINRGGKWLGLYHMGTPEAAATPAAKPEAKKM
jgi:hypothetical protein